MFHPCSRVKSFACAGLDVDRLGQCKTSHSAMFEIGEGSSVIIRFEGFLAADDIAFITEKEEMFFGNVFKGVRFFKCFEDLIVDTILFFKGLFRFVSTTGEITFGFLGSFLVVVLGIKSNVV